MFFGASGSIAGGQMYDRGQHAAARHVLLHVEDRRVVLRDGGQEQAEHILVRRREVDVAAPDPAGRRLRGRVDHRRRLRVVDDDDVVVAVELPRVLGVAAPVVLLLLLGQPLGIALERVVDGLRDVEEAVRGLDDPPFDLQPDVRHQRHERVVDLRHATAERRGRQVEHTLADERRGQLVDLGHQPRRRHRRVVRERFPSDVDEIQHGNAAPRQRYSPSRPVPGDGFILSPSSCVRFHVKTPSAN